MISKIIKLTAASLICVSLSAGNVLAAGMGVCTHMGLFGNYSNIDNIESAKKTKVPWIRDECRWQNMQSEQGGEIKIKAKDLDYIKRVDAKGINQLLILGYGNAHYDGIEKDTVVPTSEEPDYYKGWLDYVRATVNEVKDYVEAYEIWNEFNIDTFNYNDATGTDYARLYLDSKAIIDELDPDAKVICGVITGYNSKDKAYGEDIFKYISSKGNVNDSIDGFSIHLYTGLNYGNFAAGLDSWESVFDKYGYTGEVWMTENGVTADGDSGRTSEKQAAMVAKLGMQWEAYLKKNNRKGVSFWYDLRNEVGVSDYEDNFGLFDSSYVMKPSGYAMKTYNMLTGNKTFDSFDKSNGYSGKWTNDNETVYCVYDDNNSGKKINIPLSGDVAYVYDYLGNVKETITSPTGTKSIEMTSTPTYVECKTYKAKVTAATYDEQDEVVTVSGTYNGGDSVTVEVLKDGVVVESQNAVVIDREFSKWFSFNKTGEYTLRVGYPELSAAGKTGSWDEKTLNIEKTQSNPLFDASTKITYDAKSRLVKIDGAVTDYKKDQLVTVLAIPASMDINSVDIHGAAYVGQLSATEGKFTAEFEVPEWFTTDMAIYLGGTGITTKVSDNIEIAESKYVYVANLELNKGNVLKATALIRNFTETEKQVVMMIAQYNANALESVKTETKSIPAKSYSVVECSLDNVAVESEATTAKAFVWSDATGMIPLSGAEKIDL